MDLKKVFLKESSTGREISKEDFLSALNPHSQWNNSILLYKEELEKMVSMATRFKQMSQQEYAMLMDPKLAFYSFYVNSRAVFINNKTGKISSLESETNKAFLFDKKITRVPVVFDPLKKVPDILGSKSELTGWFSKSKIRISKIICYAKLIEDKTERIPTYAVYCFFDLVL